ncbi:hypothetical protein E4U31_000634 [Claviceps sp. LM219 group G6]|nr:hypothetical protein E4U31_000634 [Claviceps sp. LM219 group G6]
MTTTTTEPQAKRLKRDFGSSSVKTPVYTTQSIQPSAQGTLTMAASKPKRTIDLLPAEQLLRELLLECAQHFSGLQIWIAGGWVRDRLLGIPSSDLDLALSKVTGREFGMFLESFSARPEIGAKYQQRAADLGIPDARFSRFYIVERNNDKSKKLETAGGKLFGLDIDLVNLRKEVYDGQSRTPRMEFGTPEEDTFRRDATVNSLLFDLEKQEVVDLTGRGVEDLDAQIMRTPLDPRQTFMDDPLRVLRLIRIGSKLGFTIEPTTMRYMKDDDIREALDTMITRDRVNIELFKIMKHAHPEIAFQRLFEANLYTPVFIRLHSPLLPALQARCSPPPPPLPPQGSPSTTATQPWPATWPRAYQLLVSLLKDTGSLGKMVRSETNPEYLWTMAAYAPFADLRHEKLREAVEEASESLRTPSKLAKVLDSALRNFDSIQDMVRTVTEQPEKPPPRSVVGMAIRSWGATWTTQVTYVMLSLAASSSPSQTSSSIGADSATQKDDTADEKSAAVAEHGKEKSIEEGIHKRRDEMVQRYSLFADFVWRTGLQDAYLQRPILDGNQVQQLFGLQKGGKFLKTALDGLVEWQFDHAESGVEEAKAWLLDRREELGIPQGG